MLKNIQKTFLIESATRVVGSHPSQEGATGIGVNSSPIMTVKAAVSTQLLELLALDSTLAGGR